MVLKINSKYELRRFWRTVGAVAMLILQESHFVLEPIFLSESEPYCLFCHALFYSATVEALPA
jgi:hypothetical protein